MELEQCKKIECGREPDKEIVPEICNEQEKCWEQVHKREFEHGRDPVQMPARHIRSGVYANLTNDYMFKRV
ncbi:MAG: hypothetical protein NC115_09720, partial [Bacteroidales bacterium]|nr:hypothetical protein [Bacteroidales bacterium]